MSRQLARGAGTSFRKRARTAAPRRKHDACAGCVAAPLLAALAVAFLGGSAPLGAALCTVPGTHAGIRAAIADPACTTIQLAAGSYAESPVVRRSLALAGPIDGEAVVLGRLSALGTGVVLQLATLTVDNGCHGNALASSGGAQVVADRVEVILTPGAPCPPELPFSDDFESASTFGWSLTQP